MFNLKKKFQYYLMKNENNIYNYLPISTVLINNNEPVYVTLISEQDFSRKVVISDLKGNIIKTLLDLGDDDANIISDNDNFYVVTFNSQNSKAYKFDSETFSVVACKDFKDSNILNISINDNNLFMYDMKRGFLYQTTKDFELVNVVDFKQYSTKSMHWEAQYVAATKDGYIAISNPSTEEEFIHMKEKIFEVTDTKIVRRNDKISSIAYDKNREELYVGFFDIIFIVKDNICKEYFRVKEGGIVSLNYDENLDSLLICVSTTRNNKLSGLIKKITKQEIDKIKHEVNPFQFYEAHMGIQENSEVFDKTTKNK